MSDPFYCFTRTEYPKARAWWVHTGNCAAMGGSQGDQSTPARDTTKRGKRALRLAVCAAVMWLMVGSWAGPLGGSLSDVQDNDDATFLPSAAKSTVVSKGQTFLQPILQSHHAQIISPLDWGAPSMKILATRASKSNSATTGTTLSSGSCASSKL